MPDLKKELTEALPDDLEIITGVGDPSSPLYGQVLTVDEEKTLDDKGNPIVEGLPWSKAKTGIYLVVAVTPVVPKGDRKLLGGAVGAIPSSLCSNTKRNRKILVGTTFGRPRLHCVAQGACLELPSDLGQDRLKQQYLTEWLVHTAVEAMDNSGVIMKRNKDAAEKLSVWCAITAEEAIRATGL